MGFLSEASSGDKSEDDLKERLDATKWRRKGKLHKSLKTPEYCILGETSSPYGGLDPRMYLEPYKLLLPKENEFCLNISLRFSRIEDMIWITIARCTLEEKNLYYKISMYQRGKKNLIEKKKDHKKNNLLGRDTKFRLHTPDFT